MKKLLFSILIATSMISCAAVNNSSDNIDDTNISKTEKIGGFNQCEINTVANVVIKNVPDSAGTIVYDMPQHIFDNLNTSIKNGVLIIDSKKSNTDVKSDKIHITVYIAERLKKCDLNGVGNIHLAKGTTDDSIAIALNGVGDIDVIDISAKKISALLNGVGDIDIDGSADYAAYTLNGVGDIDAKKLIAINAEARCSGVGDISCHASNNFNGVKSGIGDIECYGNPTNRKVSGNSIKIK